jgi:hypothetical protein
MDEARSFGTKVWHFIVGVFAAIGVVAVAAIIMTLVGIAHLIN